ncbi:rhomboid family intramembrane serine protease [Ancylobacter sp. 6x-1]|uniref:Rhomboid family intramembrane serine protease n=1 Tax=Ancylobacter crimeensis TaxID=2579147 RepID=A0ABT0DC75_9HYPH|nr:rhomboid family intramembrane serine protease [Ancylobacter crimeensis]MCK0197561.1 rhomboid family intramembrane serine protease [Ancylobacter crimeensis]
MFLPLNDENPLEEVRHAYVTWALIAANVAVFLLVQQGWTGAIETSTAFSYGTIPAVLSHMAVLPEDFIHLPAEATLASYMFFHGGWGHLIVNMAFLWVFGDNVEDALGHARYLAFYFLTGIAGAIVYTLGHPASEVPLIGASAAVSGVVGAYAMLHPNVRIWVLVLMRIPLRLPAIWPIGAWILYQVWSAVTQNQADTAWLAHLGGLVAGGLLVIPMRRRGVPLWVTTRDGTPPAPPPSAAPPEGPPSGPPSAQSPR